MKLQLLSVILLNLIFTSCNNTLENEKSISKDEHLIETYTLKTPPVIGEYEGAQFKEGGFSGIYYIPGTENEFYIISDRGPNIPASNHQKANNKEIKIFPFPNYTQKLMRVKLENGIIKILSANPLYIDANIPLVGLPIPSDDQKYQEFAWRDLNSSNITLTNYGVDIEALVFENDSTFWFSEEYRPSLWKMNLKTMQKIEVFSPENGGLPKIIDKRQPNRGFEGIAFDKKETIYAMLQSPLWNPNEILENKSRLTRIVTINTRTKKTKMFMYEMNKPKGNVRIKDWKIGDIVFLKENKLLVIEHGENKGESYAEIFIININQDDEIKDELDKKHRIESFNTKENLFKETGIHVAKKTHLINIKDYTAINKLGKIEGITVINDSTIAIINDNDYGIEPINDSGKFKMNNIQTNIIRIKL